MLKGAHAIETTSSLNVPDVGTDHVSLQGKRLYYDLNLPAFIKDEGQLESGLLPACIGRQWAGLEARHQYNLGQPNPDGLPQNGQTWPHTWTTLGPLDPFTARTARGEVRPGPNDPQLVYGAAIAASVAAQESKFCVRENPGAPTRQYLNELQQVPGSHFEVQAPSWNGFENAQVVDRFADLPQSAAKWVMQKLNEKIRQDHPCFSLAGREHFELSNPPMQCGDASTIKTSPIVLLRVFDCRVRKLREGGQEVYLAMEIGNFISAGAGGMFTTVVKMDKFQNFVGFSTLKRDEKQTFVLPRERGKGHYAPL
jgi:hypothetical protein